MQRNNLFQSLAHFPDPSLYEDVVALSKQLSTSLLTEGYSRGFFPWPHGELKEIPWFHPVNRAVLFLNEIRINKTLSKLLKQHSWSLKMNQDFDTVIEKCANEKRPHQKGTWITNEILTEYKKLHRLGWAHSFEAYNASNELVGGIYGVQCTTKGIRGFFSAESMFYKESGASKACLLFLCETLKNQNEPLLDIQMLTPHLESLGAREISREDFLEILSKKNL